MSADPTDEIRAIRDRLSAACDYDVDRIFEETRRHQEESERTVIDLSTSLTAPTDTTIAQPTPSGEV